MQLMPNVDYLFSNDTEFLELSRQLNFETNDLEEIASKVAELPKSNSRPRVVVITRGSNSTIVARKWAGHGAKVTKFPVRPLDEKCIVDTIGAGDAFVGGFLAGLVSGQGLDFCIHAGCSAARHIIQRGGCTFKFEEDHEIQEVRKALIVQSSSAQTKA